MTHWHIQFSVKFNVMQFSQQLRGHQRSHNVPRYGQNQSRQYHDVRVHDVDSFEIWLDRDSCGARWSGAALRWHGLRISHRCLFDVGHPLWAGAHVAAVPADGSRRRRHLRSHGQLAEAPEAAITDERCRLDPRTYGHHAKIGWCIDHAHIIHRHCGILRWVNHGELFVSY